MTQIQPLVPTLYITRGLPGSGKTTRAEAWVAELRPRRVRIGRDPLRIMGHGGRLGTSWQEEQVTVVQRGAVRDALRAGYDVVVDDTNLVERHFLALTAIAAFAEAHVVVWDLRGVPLDTCLTRNKLRVGTPAFVPPPEIRRMHAQYIAKGSRP